MNKREIIPPANPVTEKDILPTGQVISQHNFVNRSPRDEQLVYDSDHHSYLYRSHPLTYVSDVVGSCFEPFDEEKAASLEALKTGETAEMIKEKWKCDNEKARHTGVFLHSQIENMLLGIKSQKSYYYAWSGRYHRTGGPVSVIEEMNQAAAFLSQLQSKPIRSHWVVFDETPGIVGIADLLAVNEKKELTLFDWTCSRKIGKEIQGEFRIQDETSRHAENIPLPDTPYYRKVMELNILKQIIAKRYGLTVQKMSLVIFHSDNRTWHEVQIPSSDAEACRIMASWEKGHRRGNGETAE